MRASLLPILACPVCAGDLELHDVGRDFHLADNIETGNLRCVNCHQHYPIRESIPRLRPPQDIPADAKKTRESFGWEWLRYPGSRDIDQGIFLEETMIAKEEFSSKLVLDAGCGMGRYSAVARALGAEVVSIDMSESLIRVAERAKDDPKLHPVEGDLLHPPFKKGVFDIVYSQGVLHHTSNTEAAFKAVAALLKPNGLLSVWLYGKASTFAEFSTNPIRPGRDWIVKYRRLAWTVVGIRHFFSDFLRLFTTRLPVRITYALCYPLTIMGYVPGLKYLSFSVDPNFQARLIENFDWISPPYQWHHTKEELSRWFGEMNFEVLKVLPHGLVPKPGILGRKK